ncbi:MAG: hypothetical protein ACE5E9_07825 [Nitrospinaceae bacterium]
MKIPRTIKVMLALVFLLLIGAGAYGWIEFGPVLAELQPKDPKKFESMVQEVKSFHFPTAIKLFRELENMTYEEVLYLRYETWKKRRESDKDFRLHDWDKQVALRESSRESRFKRHRRQLEDIIRINQEKTGKDLSQRWQKAGAWERGLLLREKCIKYLEREKAAARRRGNVRNLSRTAPLMSKPGKASLSVPELCERLVPISQDEQVVETSLENLKNKMKYFYFVQLLDEIGIPRKDVLTFPSKLQRMTGDFADS